MARGESEANERSTAGMVIGAVFAVACLGALLVVVSVDRDPPPPPPPTGLAPFPGAYGVLASLRWRDCPEGPETLRESLLASGYEAEPPERIDAPEGGQLPAGLGEGCGLVLLEGSGLPQAPLCGREALALPACGDDAVGVADEGSVALRRLTMPGVTPEDPTEIGLQHRLAHAEAAHLLATAGFVAGSVVTRRLTRGAGRSPPIDLPPPPRTGCVALVATVEGTFDALRVEHGGLTRARSPAPIPERGWRYAMAGIPHCAGPNGVGSIVVENVAGEGAVHVMLRAFAIPAGPGARGAAAPLTERATDLEALVGSVPAR